MNLEALRREWFGNVRGDLLAGLVVTLAPILGLNEASSTIVDKLAINDKPGAMDRLMGH